MERFAQALREIGDTTREVSRKMCIRDRNKIDYLIATNATGRKPAEHSVQMRRKAVERSIACLTAVDTAMALTECLLMDTTINDVDLVDITKI